MSDEFNFDAAVDQISSDLGFASDESAAHDDPAPDTGADPVQSQPADQNVQAPVEDADPSKKVESESPEEGDDTVHQDEQKVGAPKTWRKEAAAAWDSLPDVIKQEVAKREEDMFKGIEGYKNQAAIGSNFAQMLEPFQPYFAMTGANPYEEIQGLLGLAHTAKFGTAEQKMDMVLAIMQDCGLDPLDAAEFAQSKPQPDPQIVALQRELNQVKSAQRNDELARQNAARSTIDAQIQAFAADPKNIYFEEVIDEMAAFYNSGISKTLEDAYERAVRANPVTHAKEQARLAAEAQAQAQAKRQQAQQATAANLRTSTRQASATAPTGTIDETLEATLRDIRNRG